MRRASGLLIPVSLITFYYGVLIGGFMLLINRFPNLLPYLPVGGIDQLAAHSSDSFEPVSSLISETVFDPNGPIRLFVASIGAATLMVPISWVYFITSRNKEVDQSFVQTVVILPVIVAGIAMIVQNNLALAFSLAGVVAAVRFRFTLDQPAHALYIFTSIAVGLGAGIGALGIAAVISICFVYANLTLWKLEYGQDFSGPFLSMLTRRSRDDQEI